MNIEDTIGLLLLVGLAILILITNTTTQAPTPSPPFTLPPPNGTYTNTTLTIMAWNLQVYGPTKASRPDFLTTYLTTITQYDIILLQEIRDDTPTHEAFSALCQQLPHYNCLISSRAGSTTVKEQYGVIYKNSLALTNATDYNPDPLQRWERPPLRLDYTLPQYNLTLYVLHTTPTNVRTELSHLETLIQHTTQPTDNVIILGDLNADCVYYDADTQPEFDTWTWAITDDQRTNLGQQSCAYDRILLNPASTTEYRTSGVHTDGINDTLTDHYPVWVAITPQELL